MRCKEFCFPEKEQEGKEGEFAPALSSPLSSLCSCTLGHPRQGEIKRAGERQLVSQHLFHSNSLIFGNVTPKLQTAQVADGAKTLSWARSQLERYHSTPAHQGDSNVGIAALERSGASPAQQPVPDTHQGQVLQGKGENTPNTRICTASCKEGSPALSDTVLRHEHRMDPTAASTATGAAWWPKADTPWPQVQAKLLKMGQN